MIPRVSAIHIAARMGNMEVLQLVAQRSNINIEDQVRSFLRLSSYRLLLLLQLIWIHIYFPI